MLADQQAHIQPRTQPWASIEPHHNFFRTCVEPHTTNDISQACNEPESRTSSELASSPQHNHEPPTQPKHPRACIKLEPVAMSSSGVFVLQGMVLPKFVQSVFETVYCWCTDHLLSQSVPDRCNPLSKKVSTHFLLRSSDKKLL